MDNYFVTVKAQDGAASVLQGFAPGPNTGKYMAVSFFMKRFSFKGIAQLAHRLIHQNTTKYVQNICDMAKFTHMFTQKSTEVLPELTQQ